MLTESPFINGDEELIQNTAQIAWPDSTAITNTTYHVIGTVVENVSITYNPNGDLGESFIQWLEPGNDTGPRLMTEECAFHFKNERIAVPATGLDLGGDGAILLLFALVFLSILPVYLVQINYRKRFM